MSSKIKQKVISQNNNEVVETDSIYIKGARTHNLKNVSVGIPRNKFTVVTGVSGSGKSSLTIDTLFAEGQRRYAESLSSYARQFLSRMPAPDIDYIKGLCPAIAIEQKVITRTPRSTVGSMTEIYEYFRLLFARIGHTISPISGREVRKDDVTDIVKYISQQKESSKIFLLAKFKLQNNRDILEELNILVQKGFSRVFVFNGENSETYLIEDILEESESSLKKKFKKENTYVLIDRLVKKEFDEDEMHRIADSANTAFFEGEGDVFVSVDNGDPVIFSNRFELDGIRFEEPVPNLFSFNNPYGACPTCEGFGQVLGIDPNLVIPDKRLSIYEGAVAPWKGEKMVWWKDQFVKGASSIKFPIHKPFADLTEEQIDFLWKGSRYAQGINDFFEDIESHLYKVQNRVLLSRYRGRTPCPECHGYRLRQEALYVKINGKHIGELSNMPTKDLLVWMNNLPISDTEQKIANRLLTEIQQRLQTLIDVGLGYLTLNRLANSLSGGESQRIQLTRSLGSTLTDSLYILDEPSIGLHSRDTENLIKVLKRLRDLNNTVVVVEHDEMIMREADHIIDMGPLAAHLGGEVTAEGNYESIISNPNSLTGKYLNGTLSIEAPKKVQEWQKSIIVEGARQNNLKNITVQFPLNVFCAVTGVSGSGKTTLVKQILYPGLMKMKEGTSETVGFHKAITGDIKAINHIELVDQNPIGKSSRSNPVTYIKAYDEIRNLYAKQPLSKIRGFQPKHFSFNVDGGRCDACKGEGEQVVEMQFLTDVHLTCEVCGGKRFKEEVLEVQYKGKSIFDILELSVDEALELFKEEKNIQKAIQPLQDVGLGYIKLGQSSDTLSGGEAQRVKLASFLGQGSKAGKILFIFDEPTTGLHFNDIKKLLSSFNALINQGHSIIVIEHNTDVIKSADWVIDLGPEAGADGGNLVFAGTPKDLKKCKESYTGKYL
ncbi:MAG: excinuclease ABC subunit A [Pseudopedobacter saltans]|uniref:UvrABC system protein A n=1 Tax=Pseudopedobacter saltans TaxID=151895 RepID=A0A2W5F374_9SPHI|nr:MAG: excinuclease ABC subunit A [Pseudopedobacter saltans]